ncbi:MAG: carbohydrate ABC transporter permease [Clostridiaceae bacterium]|nr:carbohydrate ABC transporter permease [Clostridiaceae bacterium]
MHYKIKKTAGDRVFDFINLTFLSLILIIVLYPLIYIVSCSVSDSLMVISGRVWLFPIQPTLLAYKAVLENPMIVTGYANSLFYTCAGTLINLIVTFMAAYPLSRKNAICGKRFIMFFFTFTMLFSGGMVPGYLLVQKLGMINTRWALLIPGAMSVWNLIITKTFLQSNIPDELYEVAALDGSGDLRTFFRIVLPLSGTIIAVNALYYAVGHWNSYFGALLYIRKAALYPLQIVLRNILIQNQMDASMLSVVDVRDVARREALSTLLKYALIVVASLPVMCIYPFVQKYFVKGVLIGSIKG